MSRQGPRSGQHVGNKYVLGELLGVGRFGAVYRAQNELLKRTEAIKIVESYTMDVAEDPQWQQRFIREAQIQAKLEHPNIIQVYDYGFGTENEFLYLAMPFVDGGTLESLLKGPLSLPETENFLRQICSALDYMHAQGIVHLNVKPANLLLRRNESTLLLSGFELAHLVKEEKVEDHSGLQSGTFHYTAPEQINGQPQFASDIYATGVILYRMLTGKLPYAGPSVILDHVQAPIPLVSTIQPDVPAALDQVILKALAKNPADRFQSAGALLASFQSALVLPAPKPAEPPVVEPVAQKPLPVATEPEPEKSAAKPAKLAVKPEKPVAKQNNQARLARKQRRNAKKSTISKKVKRYRNQSDDFAAFDYTPEMEEELDKFLEVLNRSPAARREAFMERVYRFAYSFEGIWLLPFFLLTSLGAIVDTYAHFEVAIIVMVVVALFAYLLVYRKTTFILKFILVLLCSSALIFFLSEKMLHLFPVVAQQHAVQSSIWLLGQRDVWAGRQVNVGLIIGSIPAFILYVINIAPAKQKVPFLADMIMIVIVSFIASILLWLLVSVLGTVFNLGFGFGDGWYVGLLYLFIGDLVSIGVADFLYVLLHIVAGPNELSINNKEGKPRIIRIIGEDGE